MADSVQLIDNSQNIINNTQSIISNSQSIVSNTQSIIDNSRHINSYIINVNKFVDSTSDLAKETEKMQKAFEALPGAQFITNPFKAFGEGLKYSLKKGIEAEEQIADLATMMNGDLAKSYALFNQISDYDRESIYDKAGLIDAQKTMMSFGLSSDFAFEKLKQIGDIAAGDAGKMEAISQAFAQSQAAGKLMGNDLTKMINAGFNPLEAISQRTGESMEDLNRRMSKGAISADELSQAFSWATDEQGAFYQGSENAANTMEGKTGQLMDNLNELAVSFYSVIQPLLLPVVDLASAVVGTLGSGISWLIEKFREGNPVVVAVAGVIGVLGAAFLAYNAITTITKTIQSGLLLNLLKTNLAFLASPVFWIIAGIIALIAVIVFLAVKIKGWGTLWDATISFCKNIIKAFIEGVSLYFQGLVHAITYPLDQIRKKWYEFKLAVGMGDEDENRAAIANIDAGIENRLKEMKETAKKAGEYGKAAMSSFKDVKLELDDSVTMGSIAQKLKSQVGVTAHSTETNNTVDLSSELTTSSESISSGGRQAKNFYITINDGLIKQVDNHFGSTDENPESASDFMWKLSSALQMILNDVNYAAV